MELSQYYKDRVLFEIVKQLQGRETAFLSPNYPIRCVKAHNISYLKTNMQALGFWKRPYNVYHSLAHLQNMPMFSFEPNQRRRQQEEFTENFEQYMVGYDLALDFDSKKYGFQQCYKDVKRIKEVLDDYQIPYSLKMSGSGFHITVNDRYLLSGVEKVEYCAVFVRELGEVFNLPTLDTSIIDKRRLWKVAYSLDIRTGNVALPLTDEQFEKFNIQMVKPEVCSNIMNRGLLEHSGNSNNLQKFWDTYIGEEIPIKNEPIICCTELPIGE
jgi:hypothetical protein